MLFAPNSPRLSKVRLHPEAKILKPETVRAYRERMQSGPYLWVVDDYRNVNRKHIDWMKKFGVKVILLQRRAGVRFDIGSGSCSDWHMPLGQLYPETDGKWTSVINAQ